MITYQPHYDGIVSPENITFSGDVNGAMEDVENFKGDGKVVALVEIITMYFDNGEPYEGDFDDEDAYDLAYDTYMSNRDSYLNGLQPSKIDVDYEVMAFDSEKDFYKSLEDDPTMFTPSPNSILYVDEVGEGKFYGDDVDGLNERAWNVYVTLL